MKNKFVTALLSLAFAFGLWMYVVSVVAPESERTYIDVPVRIHGSNILESRGLMLVSDQDMRLDLELSGTRTDLNKLSSSNITVIADLSNITTAGEHQVHYSISYPGSISSGITILSPETQTVTVKVVEWTKKEVPITVDYTGQLLNEHFQADTKNITLDRNVVTVSGAKEVVDRIEKAVVTIDLTDQTTDIDQTFDLVFQDAAGRAVEMTNVTVDTEKVTVVLKINMIKTLDVIIKVMPGDGLTEADVSCRPWFDALNVIGSAAALENLTEITVPIYIGELEESGTIYWKFTLPEGVSAETGVTEIPVDVTVPARKSQYLEIPTSQIILENIPEGMQSEIVDALLMVQVQGREHRLGQLQHENIQLTVDLRDAKEGTHSYDVIVEIVGVDGVRVISAQTVEITLMPQSAEENPEA